MIRIPVRALLIAAMLSTGTVSPVSAQQSIRPLTLARLDQFIKGLEAEKTFWAPVWAKDRRTGDSIAAIQHDPMDPGGFRKKSDAYTSCQKEVASRDAEVTRFQTTTEGAMKRMTPQKMGEFGAAAHPLGERMEQAEAAGDQTQLNAVFTEMGALYAKYFGLNGADFVRMGKRVSAVTLRECGRRPLRPSREQQEAMEAEASGENGHVTYVADTLTSDVGPRISGLGDNYPLLRELISMFLANESSMTEADYDALPGGFTKAERAVIRQRMSRLKPLMSFLENQGDERAPEP